MGGRACVLPGFSASRGNSQGPNSKGAHGLRRRVNEFFWKLLAVLPRPGVDANPCRLKVRSREVFCSGPRVSLLAPAFPSSLTACMRRRTLHRCHSNARHSARLYLRRRRARADTPFLWVGPDRHYRAGGGAWRRRGSSLAACRSWFGTKTDDGNGQFRGLEREWLDTYGCVIS